MVRRFAKGRGLVDLLKKRLGKGEVEPRTYNSGGIETWIDYYMVSRSLVDRGLVRAAGVLAEPANESDHKPVVLDIDAATTLGKSRLWDDIRQAQKESDQSNAAGQGWQGQGLPAGSAVQVAEGRAAVSEDCSIHQQGE